MIGWRSSSYDFTGGGRFACVKMLSSVMVDPSVVGVAGMDALDELLLRARSGVRLLGVNSLNGLNGGVDDMVGNGFNRGVIDYQSCNKLQAAAAKNVSPLCMKNAVQISANAQRTRC
jgi:hypothetical protein